jgi:hypothetical protein
LQICSELLSQLISESAKLKALRFSLTPPLSFRGGGEAERKNPRSIASQISSLPIHPSTPAMNAHSSPARSAASSPLHLPDLLLGAATVPLLLGLVGVKVLSKLVQDAGQLSEEVFRGDRLPILTQPHPGAASTLADD